MAPRLAWFPPCFLDPMASALYIVQITQNYTQVSRPSKITYMYTLLKSWSAQSVECSKRGALHVWSAPNVKQSKYRALQIQDMSNTQLLEL